jgi:sporulation protein YlmC with PRC-barrel domain
MPHLQEAIDVGVPVREVYDQWTQFEAFPQFMEDVVEVRQLDDTHLRWVVDGGQGVGSVEWEAEITEQHPDERVAWTTLKGARHAGVVTFHRLSDETTRVMVQADWEQDDPAADTLGIDVAAMVTYRVRADLQRFREFIEERGEATGDWRGDVEAHSVDRPRDLGEDEVLPTGRLRGMDVVDPQGDDVGRISEVYVAPQTSTVRYIGISTSRLSREHHVVPIDAVDFVRRGDEDEDPVACIPWSRDQIAHAPAFPGDEDLTREHDERINGYYAHVKEYTARRDAVRARQSTPAPTPEVAEAELATHRPDEVMFERWGI